MKKALNIIKNVLVGIVVAIAVFMMVFTIISVTMFGRNDRDLFGYKAFIVLTDSMAESKNNQNEKVHFNAGDLIITKEVKDPSKLKEGDIITFQSLNEESYGEVITHKIRKHTVTDEGRPGFITYGTNTDTNDETVVTYDFVLGQYKFHIAKIGTFFNFLKQPTGYFICIFSPFMLLIIYQGLNCIKLFRKYKSEQMEEINEERRKMEEERQASAEMMKELQALKAQLEAKEKSEDKEDK